MEQKIFSFRRSGAGCAVAGLTLAAMLASGTASAYTLSAFNATDPERAGRIIANEVPFDDTVSVTVPVRLLFAASALTDDRVRLTLDVAGAAFSEALATTSVVGCQGNLTEVEISKDGKQDESTVELFFATGASCNDSTNDVNAGLTVNMPLYKIDKNSGVSITATLVGTDTSNSPVDGGAPANGALEVVGFADAYEFTIEKPAADIVAQLEPSPPFTTVASTPGLFATVRFMLNVVDEGRPITISPQGLRSPATADLSRLTYTLEGDFSAFGAGAGTAVRNVRAQSENTNFTISDDKLSATLTLSNPRGIVARATENIVIQGVSADPLATSDYKLTAAFLLDTPGDGEEFGPDGALITKVADVASVTREGTSLTYPWVSSSSRSLQTTSNNIIRVSNVTSRDSGAVYVRALTSDVAAFSVPSESVKAADSIPAGRELLLDSATLEALLGDFGRGDIEVYVEELSANLTGKRYILFGLDNVIASHPGRADRVRN